MYILYSWPLTWQFTVRCCITHLSLGKALYIHCARWFVHCTYAVRACMWGAAKSLCMTISVLAWFHLRTQHQHRFSCPKLVEEIIKSMTKYFDSSDFVRNSPVQPASSNSLLSFRLCFPFPTWPRRRRSTGLPSWIWLRCASTSQNVLQVRPPPNRLTCDCHVL